MDVINSKQSFFLVKVISKQMIFYLPFLRLLRI